jgi:hypothetical protein
MSTGFNEKGMVPSWAPELTIIIEYPDQWFDDANKTADREG